MIKIENVDIYGWEAAIRGCRNPMNSWDKSDSEFFDYDNSEYEECVIHTLTEPSLTKPYDECPDDEINCIPYFQFGGVHVGPNDYALMMKLAKAGSVEGKFRRMITVTLDITAPLYWWKEFDTYKVGTVANSCSTMHKIHSKEFTLEDFSCEHLFKAPDFEDIPDFETAYLEEITKLKETFDSMDPNDDEGYKKIVYPKSDVQREVDWHYEQGAYFAGEAQYNLEEDSCVVAEYALDLLRQTIEALNVYREKFLETKDKRYWWQMIQLLPTSYNQRRTVQLNYEVLANIYRNRKDHKLDEWREFCKWIETLPYSELITLNE